MTESVQPALPGEEASSKASARVAVVAVHGVGHHDAGASANAIANLLLGLNGYSNPPTDGPVGSFTSHGIRIPLPGAAFFSGIPPRKKEKQTFGQWLRALLEERRGFFLDKFRWSSWFGKETKDEAAKEVAEADPANEFMQVQLDEYAGDPIENHYCTWRLEGERKDANGVKDREVHVYEMYWADLASPSNSFVRFFVSLYQLLLHLVGLGRIAVDFASLEHMGKGDWFVFNRLYSYASRVFTLGIWLLLAILPVVAFSPLPLLLGHESLAQAIAAGVLLLAGFAVVWKSGARWGYLLPAALLSVGGAVALFLYSPASVSYLLTIEWWGLGTLVLSVVFAKYDEVRPGANETGRFFLGVAAVGFLVFLYLALCISENAELALRIAAFWMIQYVAAAVRISWIIFLVFAVCAAVMEGVCLWRLRRSPSAFARARAAFRTGRFTLALPAVLLVLLTLFLWSGVYQFTASRVHLYCGVAPKTHALPGPLQYLVLDSEATERVLVHAGITPPSLAPPSASCPLTAPTKGTDDPYRYLQGLLIQGAPPGFPVVLGLMTAGFVLLGLMVIPAVVLEFKTPICAANGRARRLAGWLSSAYASFRIQIWCFWLAMFAVPTLYMIYVLWLGHPSLGDKSYLETLYTSWGMDLTGQFLVAGGGVVAGSAALLIGVVVKNFSAALDAILDVDTYLRTSPAKAVPRARIVERYVALLRYLSMYRGADGKGYDRIIFVAHSLGSNITADLLRFLHSRRMEKLTKFAFGGELAAPVPLLLFSMGSPLRQLLNRFFPHLYRWMREVPDNTGTAPAVRVLAAEPIPQDATPDPSKLNLALWVNAYRSGDYVGRSVWLDDWYTRTAGTDLNGSYPKKLKIFDDAGEPILRVEVCIGLGAHTHYWDRTAPDIANILNRLI